jgi:hypothetical protein
LSDSKVIDPADPDWETKTMVPGRVLPLAIALVVLPIPEAFAQAPGGQQPPCMQDFLPLRQEAEKRASVIRAAIEKKAPQPELCSAFKEFSAAEAKVVKYADTNSVWCSVPPDAVKAMKANYAKSVKIRDQVCNGARPGGGAPPPPSLSDALTTTRMPDATNSKAGRGTFDTLTGNPLAR